MNTYHCSVPGQKLRRAAKHNPPTRGKVTSSGKLHISYSQARRCRVTVRGFGFVLWGGLCVQNVLVYAIGSKIIGTVVRSRLQTIHLHSSLVRCKKGLQTIPYTDVQSCE